MCGIESPELKNNLGRSRLGCQALLSVWTMPLVFARNTFWFKISRQEPYKMYSTIANLCGDISFKSSYMHEFFPV